MEVKKYLKVDRKKIEMLSVLLRDEELMMLNLFKYKDTVTETGFSGAASYRENMKAAIPFFNRAEAEAAFFGESESTLIGPEGGDLWDDVLTVKYRNPSSFFRMVQEERYPSELREQALLDSRLIYCKSHLDKKSK